MLVVGIYKDNAENFAGLTIVNDWKDFTRRLRYYFSNIFEIKEKIINGEIIDLPYITLQRDRRKKDIPVMKDRRESQGLS